MSYLEEDLPDSTPASPSERDAIAYRIGKTIAAQVSMIKFFAPAGTLHEVLAGPVMSALKTSLVPSEFSALQAAFSAPSVRVLSADRTQVVGVVCSECGSSMYKSPSGTVCDNGHGGEGITPATWAIKNSLSDHVRKPFVPVRPESHPKLDVNAGVEPTWTNSQTKALVKIESWLTEINEARKSGPKPGSRYFVLRGFPGTGKSFMQKFIRDKWQDQLNFAFSAPTHQACSVLSKYINAPVSTLASRLGVKATIQEDRLVFELPEKFPELPASTILCVDEASQLNTEYVDFIDRLAEALDIYVMYVGDHAQLNPIGEKISKVWKLCKGTEYEAILTDVRRNAGPGLPMLAALRSCIFKKNYVNPVMGFHDNDTVFFHPTERKFLRSVRDNLDSFDAGEAKLISWRNTRVNYLASVVRELLGYDPDNFCTGERFTLDGSFIPYADTQEEEFGANGEDVVLKEIQPGLFNLHREVREFLPDWDVPTLPITALTLYSESRDAAANGALLTDSDSQATMNRLYAQLAARARGLSDEARRSGSRSYESKRCWEVFWELKKSFVSLRSGYSATSHTFQGSETQVVFVDCQDILANKNKPEAFRCLYTAASRFRQTIHFM